MFDERPQRGLEEKLAEKGTQRVQKRVVGGGLRERQGVGLGGENRKMGRSAVIVSGWGWWS